MNLMVRERAEEKDVSCSWCGMQSVSDIFSVLTGGLGDKTHQQFLAHLFFPGNLF